MNYPTRFVACFSFVLVISQAQIVQRQYQPTPLEAFARQPNSHIAWSNEAGRIDSREAHAVVTALIVEDGAQPPDRMRGIRVDLLDQDGRDQVYLGEETLGAFKKAMDEISQAAAHGCAWNSGDVCPPNAYVGAALFWYGDRVPSVHTLSASHHFGERGSGLFLSTFGGGHFYFPDRDASQLSAAIARALEQLKER